VHKILYLIFTEGYLSSHAELAIRRELCNEALRLGAILAEDPVGQVPETFALLALMHLHAVSPIPPTGSSEAAVSNEYSGGARGVNVRGGKG
jgi:predicted RNA polymerase sigma factor